MTFVERWKLLPGQNVECQEDEHPDQKPDKTRLPFIGKYVLEDTGHEHSAEQGIHLSCPGIIRVAQCGKPGAIRLA